MEPIVLNPEVMSLLLKLASEEGKTPEDIISEMIEKRDSDRHVVWQPGVGHVRVKCDSKTCFETNVRKSGWRD